MTDEQIAQMLRQKYKDIFDYIMEHFNKLLWVVVGNIIGKASSAEEIEDCIIDVYIKLLENPKIYDPNKGSFKSFLVRVGKNLAIDKYRKLTRGNAVARHNDYDDYTDYDDGDLLRSLLTKESREIIMDALNTLKEPDMEILVRRYFFNEKVKVISEKMSLQAKEVENKLYQGKLKLKSLLTNTEGFR